MPSSPLLGAAGTQQPRSADFSLLPLVQINEAVDIHPANTFTRAGYTFIGWARVDSTTPGYTISPKDLDADDLCLKYENGKFYAKIPDSTGAWTEVTQIAADERDPYHDIYAVWEEKKYTVTVKKELGGVELDGDDKTPFTFTPTFTGLSGSDYTSAFQLVANVNGADVERGGSTVHYSNTKVFTQIPYDTVFAITEQANTEFNVSAYYIVTNADNPEDNGTFISTNGGQIAVRGDIELIVTNSRKYREIRVQKTKLDGETPLGGAVFSVNVGGTDYTLTSDIRDGYLKNELFADGVLLVPYGTYSLSEEDPPAGYTPLTSAVTITVNESGVLAAPYTVKPPTQTEPYTIIIPNNPGVVLPSTGGSGVTGYYLAGVNMILAAGLLLLIRRRKVR